MTIPQAFATFANIEGRITRLPVKYSKKVALAEWLLTLLDPSKVYSEVEINDIFGEYVDDFALMRRLLIDTGLLTRDAYGREYKRTRAAS